MRYYVAPMEGLTGSLFRKAHYELFPGADRYYTPFISPTAEHVFTARERREILPDITRGIPLVPQLLTKNAPDFLWAARSLAEMGYEEVNLNLGCPSRTVTAKGKGSAMLGDVDALRRFLDELFAGVEGYKVSIKTRIGVKETDEFSALLDLYNGYPICELTIHPRTTKEMYTGFAHRNVFAAARERTSLTLCYNGDIDTPGEALAMDSVFPGLEAVMIGRAAVRNPAFFRQIKGGRALEKSELRAFHETMYSGYRELFDRRIAMKKMKELWNAWIRNFADCDKIAKKLARSEDVAQFDFWVEAAFQELTLEPVTESRRTV